MRPKINKAPTPKKSKHDRKRDENGVITGLVRLRNVNGVTVIADELASFKLPGPLAV